MQGGRGRGNPFLGFPDPFADFGGIPNFFGGQDPFFTRPFGGMFSSGPMGPTGSPFMDFNQFGSSFFGPRPSSFMNEQIPRIHENRSSVTDNSRGPIIEEINSDDENDGENSKIQPYIQHPDEQFQGREQFENKFRMMNHEPQGHSFRYQSSSVTYGGSNGAYHTSSMTKRTGSDGLRFEEYKEADSVTGQAAHRLSRGIHDKGRTISRNLKSDGEVETMQVLHNINEDEIGGFEEAWKGKARKHLPPWIAAHQGLDEPTRGGWALPSTGELGSHVGATRKPDGGEVAQSSKIRRR